MHIIVHAGLQKTGSTAVQHYLHAVQHTMHADGWIYPELGAKSHWKLAVALGEERKRKDTAQPRGYLDHRAAKETASLAEIRSRVETAIESVPSDGVVILSHENFSVPPQAAALFRFLDQVAPRAEKHTIGYVRHPVSAYCSGVQQRIKGRIPFKSPSSWVSSHPSRAAGLRRAFGARTSIRLHDRSLLVNGDVVEDFRATCQQLVGRALPTAPKSFVTNSSLSAPACALLYLHQKDHPTKAKPAKMLRRAVDRFAAGRSDPKLQLPPEWDHAIAAGNHQNWNNTISHLSFDKEVKSRLRLQAPTTTVPKITNRQVGDWLSAYLTTDYLESFVAFLKEGTDKPHSDETLAWLRNEAARVAV